eukprot:SAG22_NODE_9218_length_602_cov_1.648111_1_plen_65_part_10
MAELPFRETEAWSRLDRLADVFIAAQVSSKTLLPSLVLPLETVSKTVPFLAVCLPLQHALDQADT